MNDCNLGASSSNLKSEPITTLQGKNRELIDSISENTSLLKGLEELNSRLSIICNRINPHDYFGNMDKDLKQGANGLSESKGESPKRYLDGVVGAMDTHIAEVQHWVSLLNKQIDLAHRNASYLQEQI